MSYEFDHVAQIVPDIAEAIAWYEKTLPGVTVLHQDSTWGFIEAGGVKLAFVVADQHPNHFAWRVDDAELERVARENDKEIKPHRDGTRSIYLDGPGGAAIEIISYPPNSL